MKNRAFRIFISRLIFTLFFIAAVGNIHAQSRKQLEAKRKRVERELARSQKILKTTTKKKRATLHQLTTIKKVIQQREELIRSIQAEIIATDNEIGYRTKQLDTLKLELEEAKSKLNETIIKAYKTRKSGREIAFVFSSDNLRQAIRRWKYLRKLSDYRRYQIAEISDQQQKISNAITLLNKIKQDKLILLGQRESEKKNLQGDIKTKESMVSELAAKEDDLLKQIKAKQRQMAQLNSAIKKAIEKEIAAEKRRQARRNKNKKNNTNSASALTPEARKLSDQFEKNAGGLPWPLKTGFISQSFGTHQHPEFKGIQIQNNGIDITTNKGNAVKAVFNGTVSSILSIPGQGEAVLLNHGEYFTVYSRLETVSVNKGQLIKTGDVLGKVMTDDDGKTILQFQVWKGQNKLNPQSWIKSR